MKISRLRASRFLSFSELDLEFTSPITVITGPNGAGKSNVARCLDLAVAALREAASNGATVMTGPLVQYTNAGHDGSDRFTVEVGLEFDDQDESDILLLFTRAALLSRLPDQLFDAAADDTLQDRMDHGTIAPLLRGNLSVRYDRAHRQPWHVTWSSFTSGLSAVLWGDSQTYLINGDDGGHPVIRSDEDAMGVVVDDGQATAWNSASVDDLSKLVPEGQKISFTVRLRPQDPQPPSIHELVRIVGGPREVHERMGLAPVLHYLISRGVTLTDNQRLPLRTTYSVAELQIPARLTDGSEVPLALFQAQTGDAPSRDRYKRIQKRFQALTGRALAVRVEVSGEQIVVAPQVVDGGGELPVGFAGAGASEALVLATLTQQLGSRALVLDEPAVNLAPLVQRRLLGQLAADGRQAIVITHSSELVPIDAARLSGVLRLSNSGGSTQVAAYRGGSDERWQRLLAASEIRAVLFASGVVICEGETDVGALTTWLEDGTEHSPEARGVMLIDGGGDKNIANCIRLCDAWSVPWAAFVDGPALRPTSQPAKAIGVPDGLEESADVDVARAAWRSRHIFSVAKAYGDDGSLGGEFETYLTDLDADAYTRAKAEAGRSKVRAGRLFANEVPCPNDIKTLWRDILADFAGRSSSSAR